jgi:hypothetical protein
LVPHWEVPTAEVLAEEVLAGALLVLPAPVVLPVELVLELEFELLLQPAVAAASAITAAARTAVLCAFISPPFRW